MLNFSLKIPFRNKIMLLHNIIYFFSTENTLISFSESKADISLEYME